jgi:hypothetical protein
LKIFENKKRKLSSIYSLTQPQKAAKMLKVSHPLSSHDRNVLYLSAVKLQNFLMTEKKNLQENSFKRKYFSNSVMLLKRDGKLFKDMLIVIETVSQHLVLFGFIKRKLAFTNFSHLVTR